jgi:hypothetical protein
MIAAIAAGIPTTGSGKPLARERVGPGSRARAIVASAHSAP